MAWRQTGDKPLSETMMTYMRHSASMSKLGIRISDMIRVSSDCKAEVPASENISWFDLMKQLYQAPFSNF